MIIQKVLFDLDGTLFDTQKLHAAVESQLMACHGVSLDPVDLTGRFAGIPTKRVFMDALKCDERTAEVLERKKWDILLPRFAESVPLTDLVGLFDFLVARGVGISIGTASPKVWATDILTHHGLMEYFEDGSVIGGDMVVNGKPAPDIWIRASNGVLPEHCLVVEDGIAGVEGASVAGMWSALLLPKRHEKAHSLSNLNDLFELLT